MNFTISTTLDGRLTPVPQIIFVVKNDRKVHYYRFDSKCLKLVRAIDGIHIGFDNAGNTYYSLHDKYVYCEGKIVHAVDDEKSMPLSFIRNDNLFIHINDLPSEIYDCATGMVKRIYPPAGGSIKDVHVYKNWPIPIGYYSHIYYDTYDDGVPITPDDEPTIYNADNYADHWTFRDSCLWMSGAYMILLDQYRLLVYGYDSGLLIVTYSPDSRAYTSKKLPYNGDKVYLDRKNKLIHNGGVILTMDAFERVNRLSEFNVVDCLSWGDANVTDWYVHGGKRYYPFSILRLFGAKGLNRNVCGVIESFI